MAGLINLKLLTDFFNKIGHEPTFTRDSCALSPKPFSDFSALCRDTCCRQHSRCPGGGLKK
jgi:hypothetical protein